MNLIVDFLSCLWEYAKEEITREIGAVADLSQQFHSILLFLERSSLSPGAHRLCRRAGDLPSGVGRKRM